MSAIDQLIRLTAEYGRAAGLTETTVSTRVFNDGKKLSALRAGKDIQTRRLEDALRWLSANWPEGAAWPEDIERPAATAVAA